VQQNAMMKRKNGIATRGFSHPQKRRSRAGGNPGFHELAVTLAKWDSRLRGNDVGKAGGYEARLI
jgi:hypothetical protein